MIVIYLTCSKRLEWTSEWVMSDGWWEWWWWQRWWGELRHDWRGWRNMNLGVDFWDGVMQWFILLLFLCFVCFYCCCLWWRIKLCVMHIWMSDLWFSVRRYRDGWWARRGDNRWGMGTATGSGGARNLILGGICLNYFKTCVNVPHVNKTVTDFGRVYIPIYPPSLRPWRRGRTDIKL